jgi:cytochrome c biogenesis protein CcdA
MLTVIPAFLAQLAGTSLDVSDLKRREVLLGIFLFVVGFSAVFALLGVVLGAVLQGMGVLVFTNKLSLLANFQLLNEVLL